MPDEKIVYILGAGCSAGEPPTGPGFPLASGFSTALKTFSQDLNEGCFRLKKCVLDTIDLLQQENNPTLDTLVARLGAAANDLTRVITPDERKKFRQQIYNAKIATAALFIDLERKARKTGLTRYDNLFAELFGNSTNWDPTSKKSRCDVLTFNYDRLFEIAFLSRFKPDTGQYPLYGKSLLNSGLDFISENDSNISFSLERFAFLKLHGSAGMKVQSDAYGRCIHTVYDGLPGSDEKPINDNLFFAHGRGEPLIEPLIVFPHEKPCVTQISPNRLSFSDYIPRIWHEAKRRVVRATRIYAIGYSFADMDRDDVLDLLRSAKNCKQLLVQNRPGAAEDICERLKKKWFEPAGINLDVESLAQPF